MNIYFMVIFRLGQLSPLHHDFSDPSRQQITPGRWHKIVKPVKSCRGTFAPPTYDLPNLFFCAPKRNVISAKYRGTVRPPSARMLRLAGRFVAAARTEAMLYIVIKLTHGRRGKGELPVMHVSFMHFVLDEEIWLFLSLASQNQSLRPRTLQDSRLEEAGEFSWE